MSAILAVVILAVAVWFVGTLAGGPTGSGSRSSVSDFAKAMQALDPSGPSRQAHRQPQPHRQHQPQPQHQPQSPQPRPRSPRP